MVVYPARPPRKGRLMLKALIVLMMLMLIYLLLGD